MTATVEQLRERIEQLVRAGDTRRLKDLRDQLKSTVDRKQSGTRAAKYGADPVAWVRERLGQTVWSRQGEILNAIRDHRRTAVRSGHGVGKSHVASLAACWWLDVHPPGTAFVVTTAPTGAQVKAILWRYIRRNHRRASLPGRVNQAEWLIDDELVAIGRKPADHDEEAFQGIHARYVLVIIDEACGVPEQLWIAADALTTNADCRLLAIGNPDNPASHFRKVCTPGSGWHTIGVSAFDSPNLTGEPVPDEVASALVGAEWVEEKRTEWGEDNPLYRAKVLGEFSEDAQNQIVRTSDVAACRITPDTPPAGEDLAPAPVELGVDVGGGGDETVIRERRGRQAGREWRAQTDRPEKIAPMILHAIGETSATKVKIDSIGIGFGVIGELRNNPKLRGVQIVAVNVAEKASRPDKFLNLRAELWWEVGRGLSERRGWDLSAMDNADTTVAQLVEPHWDVDPQGRIRVEKKDDVRARLGRSPDNADALLLAFYAAARPRIRWM